MLEKAEETTDLVVAEKLDVEKVFTKNGIEELLSEIEKKVDAHVPDISTNQGRQDVISLAYKVSQSKVAIVKVGEASVAEYKKKVKDRSALLKIVSTRLDSLRDKTRQPVTDWEIEQEKLKAEEEALQKAINDKRVADLLAVECVMPYIEIATMTDEEFQNLLEGKTLEFEEAQKLKAIKEAEQRAEAERLAQQKAEQDAEAKRLAKIQADLDAQAKAVQDEKDRIAREEQAKKDAEEAKIKAEQEAKAKAEREAKEAEERKLAAEAEEERQEALRPDKDKIVKWLIDITIVANRIPKINDESLKDFVADSKMSIIAVLDGLEEKTRML